MIRSSSLVARRLPVMGVAENASRLVVRVWLVLVGCLAVAVLTVLPVQSACAYPEVGVPAMRIGECTSCHMTYPAAHSLDSCSACHGTGGDPHYGTEVPSPTPAGGCLGGDYSCHTKGPQSVYLHGSATDYWGSTSYLGDYGESYTGTPLLFGAYDAPFDCLDCHTSANPTVPRHEPLTLAAQHQSTTTGSCIDSGCHNASLVTEHAKYPTGSTAKYQCSLCHSTEASTEVKLAVANGNTNCDACHAGGGDHGAFHVTAVPAVACQASGCHPGATLLDVHSALTCDACHSSSNTTVTDAIAAGDKRCATCHPGGGPHAASHAGGVSRNDCLDCHTSNIAVEHQNDCAKCHSSLDPKVLAAISSGNVTCPSCHFPGIHPAGFFSNKTDYYQWSTTPGPRDSGPALGTLGANPSNPGVHANYLATTAKCGICHSVHRAAGDGTKLLPTSDATCAGCHTGGTAITTKIITVTGVNTQYTIDGLGGAAGGGGGPHNDGPDTLYEDGIWDGIGTPPDPSFALDARYGCFTRRCHATNPHGANSSKYAIFASKLLFNNSPAQDDATYPELVNENGSGTYGGLDAQYDALGATDASVQRFADANAGIITLAGGEILLNGVAPDAAETHALVAGLTCGRPSNPNTGEDECHAEASYAIVDKGIRENRNHATKISGNDNSLPAYPDAASGGSDNYFRTDNTGGEAAGYGGNDNRDSKTGHVAGSFSAVPENGSYAPINGCTSCHDQTDSANTVAGNYTFPHGQTPTGNTNLTTSGGVSATGVRSRIWSGYSGGVGATLTVTAGSPEKAFDGQCLKCHRDGAGNGIGQTK